MGAEITNRLPLAFFCELVGERFHLQGMIDDDASTVEEDVRMELISTRE